MYKIKFYKNKKGQQPALDFIREISSKKDKDSKINANKINDYLEALRQNGTRLGMPYVRHIEGDLWELRPLGNRIFFLVWIDGIFVMLHAYEKKSQKIPEKELNKARQEIKELRERGV